MVNEVTMTLQKYCWSSLMARTLQTLYTLHWVVEGCLLRECEEKSILLLTITVYRLEANIHTVPMLAVSLRFSSSATSLADGLHGFDWYHLTLLSSPVLICRRHSSLPSFLNDIKPSFWLISMAYILLSFSRVTFLLKNFCSVKVRNVFKYFLPEKLFSKVFLC